MIRNRNRWPALACAVILACLASTTAESETSSEAPARPRADDVLRKMSQALAAAKTFSFHAEINFDDVTPVGFKLQYAGAIDVVGRRPNRLYVDYRDDLVAKRLWYDGKSITLLDRDHNVFASASVGSDIDSALDEFAASYGVSLPLADVLASNAYEALIDRVKRKRWIGVNDVDGVPCDHLAFIEDEIDWQIWVERGAQPLPRKLVVTYKQLPHSPQYMANLMDWDLSATTSDAAFSAKTPEDAVRAEFMQIEEVRR